MTPPGANNVLMDYVSKVSSHHSKYVPMRSSLKHEYQIFSDAELNRTFDDHINVRLLYFSLMFSLLTITKSTSSRVHTSKAFQPTLPKICTPFSANGQTRSPTVPSGSTDAESVPDGTTPGSQDPIHTITAIVVATQDRTAAGRIPISSF